MRRTLEIELRSDLCAGVGKHYAAVIDLDTALDENGIPYIPAKRLKGCMREIADQLFDLAPEKDKLNVVFGERGACVPGTLQMTDARIKGYEDQLDEIKEAIANGDIRANDIASLFCSVRAETAVENETVKEGSLRFIRVVNRTSPLTAEPLRFYAELAFEDEDEEMVTAICKGLRNIGYKRNRGFGLVRCSLLPPDQPFEPEQAQFDDASRYSLTYLVYLEEDLMLPAADANHSMDFIPGTSVLGAFAAEYRKRYGEQGFDEIFFSDRVTFGNLYISDRNGGDYCPAPRFLAKIKAAKEEEKGLHNMIAKQEEDAQKEQKPQYKPLKKGYVSTTGAYKETETEIVYHNALNTKESKENNGGLYMQYCVSSGQYFKGRITADGKSMRKLYPLFENGVFRFGRSKTAQYSYCVIKKPSDISIQKESEETILLNPGTVAAFLCESDVALVKDGTHTVRLEELCRALNQAFGVPLAEYDSLNKFTSLSTRIVSGYNAKWNLKKPQFPVIKAGSVVVFLVKEDAVVPGSATIGVRKNEGFGRIRLIGDAGRFLEEYLQGDHSKANVEQPENILSDASSELLRAVNRQKENERILEQAIKGAETIAKKLDASQIGRLTLMCRESEDHVSLKRRIESIKTDSFRACAEKDLLDKINEYADWQQAKRYCIALLTAAKYKLKVTEGRQ